MERSKNDSLLEMAVAAIAITTTIFLLYKFLTPPAISNNEQQPGDKRSGNDCYNNTGNPRYNSDSAQKMSYNRLQRPEIQQVEVVEFDPCLVPDGFVQYYRNGMGYEQQDWGELNPDSPDFSMNRNV